MVSSNNLASAAKSIAKFVAITFGAYFAGIILVIVMGYVQEDVVPALGLNTSGAAVTQLNTFFSGFYTAVGAIVAIITVITGLLTLNVVLQAFGINIKTMIGSGSRV